jgi:hypothetical protein
MLAIRLEFTDGTHGVFRILPPDFGDADGDGQVGVGDLRLTVPYWSGPSVEDTPTPAAFDLDADGDVDLGDTAMLQQLLQ